MAVIAKITLDEEGEARPQVDIGGTLYALKNISDFDLKEYGKLLRDKEFVDTLNLAELSADMAEGLDRVLDEIVNLIFYDTVPADLLDRLRTVQKLSILEAFTDASAGSSEPTTLTARSRRSRRSMASARSTG